MARPRRVPIAMGGPTNAEWFGRTADERFWAKVIKAPGAGCWTWTGAKGKHGYGSFTVMGPSGWRRERVHIWAYVDRYGPVPDGLVLDHVCRNTLCVNPDHLEAVTQRENVLRSRGVTAMQARQTHCKRGHRLGGHNLIVGPDGHRRCRECRRRLSREYRARRKQMSGQR